ncbi:MAG: LysR family transcriptional regulator [Verrucomicrobiota bacterium]
MKSIHPSSVPLDSRQLRAFIILSRTGNFTLAAKELHLTQSAISHSMKALEQDVGCKILTIVGKKILLTQAGEHLLHHAEKILQEMETTRASLQQLNQWGAGRLRIGASTTACQYILPAVLREFKKRFPEYAIRVQPDDTTDAMIALLENQIDLAIGLEPGKSEPFEFHPLFTDELFFLCSPQHPWAVGKTVARAEIPRQNYVLYSRASYTFRMVQNYFRHDEMALNTVIELGSMEAIKEMVKLDLGISILAPWIARQELDEGSLVALPLGKRKLKRHWGVFHLPRHRLNLAEETFIKLCFSATRELSA